MNDENIHIKDPDDDKIIVKDNTQIVKLQGPQGDPGPQGPPGPPGPPGTGANVDLSPYATKQDADNLYLKKVDIRKYLTMLGDPKYALKTELNDYLSKTDATNNYA